MIKYKEKFLGKVPKSTFEEEEHVGGLAAVMVDYDSFFNGKREHYQMMRALKESMKNLSHRKFLNLKKGNST